MFPCSVGRCWRIVNPIIWPPAPPSRNCFSIFLVLQWISLFSIQGKWHKNLLWFRKYRTIDFLSLRDCKTNSCYFMWQICVGGWGRLWGGSGDAYLKPINWFSLQEFWELYWLYKSQELVHRTFLEAFPPKCAFFTSTFKVGENPQLFAVERGIGKLAYLIFCEGLAAFGK